MSIKITSNSVYDASYFKSRINQADKKQKREKVMLAGLTALGAAAAALIICKKKGCKGSKKLKDEFIDNKHLQNLSKGEKEKLIKELQAKTDNPDVKDEIRKLVENGEWDKLP